MEVFETKVRKVGSSMGVIIPSKILEETRVKEGEVVSVSLVKKNLNAIALAFGSAKGKLVFDREHEDRF